MKDKVSKEQWLDQALKVISQKGFGRVNIDRLVASLGVTKGSFYWHFKNRSDFVARLIEYWDRKFTLLVTTYINKFEGTSSDRLLELMLFISRNRLTEYDFAIHALAQNEPEVFPMVKSLTNS